MLNFWMLSRCLVKRLTNQPRQKRWVREDVANTYCIHKFLRMNFPEFNVSSVIECHDQGEPPKRNLRLRPRRGIRLALSLPHTIS